MNLACRTERNKTIFKLERQRLQDPVQVLERSQCFHDHYMMTCSYKQSDLIRNGLVLLMHHTACNEMYFSFIILMIYSFSNDVAVRISVTIGPNLAISSFEL